MKRNSKIVSFCLIILMLLVSGHIVYAHGGRTDGSGGHRDNRNVSGLGYYHYHHGYSAHLHPNGDCPYSNNSSPPSVNIVPKRNSLSLISTPEKLTVGDIYFLEWKTSNEADKYQVEWTSSDKSIASVDDMGILSAKKVGSVIINGEIDGAIKSFSLEIRGIEVETIQIPNKINRIKNGMEHGLLHIVSPKNATNKKITWESTDEEVAIIDSKGLISTKSIGTTTIKAKSENGIVEMFDLEVYEIMPTEILTNHNSIELSVGEKIKLDVKIIPIDAINKDVEWAISREGYFEIKNGEIIAKKPGISSIILTIGDLRKEIPVEVQFNPVERIEFDYESIPFIFSDYIDLGSSFTPNIVVFPEDASNNNIEITSNDGKTRIINNQVMIIGEGPGEVIVKIGEVEKILRYNAINLNDVRRTIMGSVVFIGTIVLGKVGLYYQKRREENVSNN